MTMTEVEDILSSSLQLLYAYAPVSFWGDVLVHEQSGCAFETPDPAASNWKLHASSIWIASLFLANRIGDVSDDHDNEDTPTPREAMTKEVLELGAGSGMPGIVLVKQDIDKNTLVTLSDFPDPSIIACLHKNIARNNIPITRIRVVGHIWGDKDSIVNLGSNSFDIIIAADTLWNPELHIPLCQTLQMALKMSVNARIHLVAGLHTGRWIIQGFIQKLPQFGFILESITERFAGLDSFVKDNELEELRSLEPAPDREWNIDRQEDEAERRQWVVWIIVKWDPVRFISTEMNYHNLSNYAQIFPIS